MEKVYTVPEVAEILGCSSDYVYKLRDSGILCFIRIGRWKCRESTLEEFLAKYDGFDISDPFNIKELEFTRS